MPFSAPIHRLRRRAIRRARLIPSLMAAVGLVALLGGGSAQAAGSTNLVQNPSLESASNGVPTCWKLGGYGTNSYTWSRTTDAHSGSYSEGLTISSFSSGDRKLLPTQDSGACAPAATAGSTYAAGAWYKQPAGATGGPRFFAYYRTSSGTWNYWAESPRFAASSSWTHATWSTPAFPTGATNISVGLGLDRVGTVTMDDFSLAPTSAPERRHNGAIGPGQRQRYRR